LGDKITSKPTGVLDNHRSHAVAFDAIK
jgi:hypothetical protein